MTQFHDKNVLVTGALGGIGAAICHAFARRGTTLLAHDRVGEDDDKVAELERSLIAAGAGGFRYVRADLASRDEIHAMFSTLRSDGHAIDILVNNAGIQKTSPVEDFDDDTWEKIVAVNLVAVHHCIKQSLPDMRRKGWGRIINLASVHGLVGSVNKTAYVAAKHGVVGLTKVIALEAARDGITANAICPGWTDTAIIAPQIEAKGRAIGATTREAAVEALVSEKQPNGKLIDPAHIGELAAFLGSDAAEHMTGVSLPIDGGWTCV
ncbi:3-hydroxybutyrate dehydrogenase [Halomonas organivorans]